MKIHPSQAGRIPEVYQAGNPQARPPRRLAGGAPAERRTQQLTLSEQAKELHAARKKLSELPEVREDRVEHLTREIQAGRYRVDSAEVARAIVRRRRDFRP